MLSGESVSKPVSFPRFPVVNINAGLRVFILSARLNRVFTNVWHQHAGKHFPVLPNISLHCCLSFTTTEAGAAGLSLKFSELAYVLTC